MQNPEHVSPGPVAMLEEACGVVEGIIANIAPEQLDLPTVNDEWNVRELIEHLVRGNVWAVQNLETGGAPRPTEDLIGDRSPTQAFSASAQAMIKAFQAPGALSTVVTMPMGEMPGAGLAMLRTGDLISHAWDLAVATGQERNIAPSICEAMLEMSRTRFAGKDRARMPFKEPVTVSEAAHAADRLAGFLGKPVPA